MKALVTGATGFVGSYLAEYLLEKGYKVAGIYRRRSPKNNINNLKKLTLFECELKEYSKVYDVLKAYKPDIIFHLAAQSFVPTSFDNPYDTFENNVHTTINILESLRKIKIYPKIHLSSTADVYGKIDTSTSYIDEKVPLKPLSPYASSKISAEFFSLQYFYTYNIPIIITRAFNHTGPRRDSFFAESSFAKQIAEIEKKLKRPIIKVGNLESTRTFCDVRDMVKAYELAAIKCIPGEIYNVAGDTKIKIDTLLKKLLSFNTSNKKIQIILDKKLFRITDTDMPSPDDNKFRKATNWKPEINFDTTLSDLLNWWRVEIKK